MGVSFDVGGRGVVASCSDDGRSRDGLIRDGGDGSDGDRDFEGPVGAFRT